MRMFGNARVVGNALNMAIRKMGSRLIAKAAEKKSEVGGNQASRPVLVSRFMPPVELVRGGK